MIIKRDGTKQKFDINKVVNAIHKALLSNNLDDITLAEHIAKGIDFSKTYTVEGIQDLVEQALMETGLYPAARNYITYRNLHNTIRQQAQANIDFIHRFIDSDNTANATIDDNSNVNTHNIAVLNSEIHKENNQITNLQILENKIKELYPDFDYKQMKKDFNTIAYLHDSSSQIGMPYCVAITMYPFLLNGIKDLGGLSASPKNIDSFCGMFVNMVFAIAGQFKGAVATPGVLNCFDYFCRKEWGDYYHTKLDVEISSIHCLNKKTIRKQIHQYFQQIVYSLMQPSGSRGSQACFWNLSVFDKPFFDSMYSDFKFPDGTPANWDSLCWLQKEFVSWLNEERLKCILTFPVVSVCLIYQDGKFLDEDLYEFVCSEYAKGNSFFTYISDSADSLSSCCRLSSKLAKPQFNFTNGQLSEMTGSKNVITLNINRITQDFVNSIAEKGITTLDSEFDKKVDTSEKAINTVRNSIITRIKHNGWPEGKNLFKQYIITILDRIYKYQIAYNECLIDLYNARMLSVYDAGFIDLKKQYLTIGINGLNQAAEYLGIQCNNNAEYKAFCTLVFTTIKEQNQLHKTKDVMFNTECTPCESASIKLYNRDKQDGYWVPEDTNLYASYIFKPNDKEISVLDKFILHGKEFCGDNLDGGSAAHINLAEHLSVEQYRKLVSFAAEAGCKYFTFNIPNSECDDCGFICKQSITKCPKCGSTNISLWDRIIG